MAIFGLIGGIDLLRSFSRESVVQISVSTPVAERDPFKIVSQVRGGLETVGS